MHFSISNCHFSIVWTQYFTIFSSRKIYSLHHRIYWQLLKIPRFGVIEGCFLKLLHASRFFLKYFYFFFNRVARYNQSKEMYCRDALQCVSTSKIPQIICKGIFRNRPYLDLEINQPIYLQYMFIDLNFPMVGYTNSKFKNYFEIQSNNVASRKQNLHHEAIFSTSRSSSSASWGKFIYITINFEAIYQSTIDSIPPQSWYPTMKQSIIGYKYLVHPNG